MHGDSKYMCILILSVWESTKVDIRGERRQKSTSSGTVLLAVVAVDKCCKCSECRYHSLEGAFSNDLT